MRTLRNPSQGVDVYFLQRLLNKAASRSGGRFSRIREDGRFGPRTEAAVRAFQGLPGAPHIVTGIVANQTWTALGARTEVDHPLTLVPQGTNWNCWQSASTMVAAARGVPASVSTSSNHMAYYLSSGMSGVAADQQLARELGWQTLDHSPNLSELLGILRRTPIYVSGRLTATGGAHAVAFGGVYSDDTPDGTVIIVYNPSPVGTGLVHQLFFDNMTSPISGSPFVPFTFLVPR